MAIRSVKVDEKSSLLSKLSLVSTEIGPGRIGDANVPREAQRMLNS